MIAFIVLACVCVCGSVPVPEADPQPAAYASDYSYYLPANNPSSQYHAQDELGAYTYGYNSAEQTKSEVKTADGVVRGSYSYIDANGIVQTVNYISDAMGFRVAATNLPVHEVEAAAVPAAAPVVQEAAVPAAVAVAAPEQVLTPNVPYAYLPYATNYGYHVAPTQYVHAAPVVQAANPVVQAATPVVQAATPVVHAASPVVYQEATPVVEAAISSGEAAIPVVYQEAAPVVQAAAIAAPVPVVAAPTDQVFSKYHAQDELGQYSFGYNDATSNRQEAKTADGVVTGSYNYVDSNGRIQTVQYIADAAGFRVAGTNLPVHAAALPIDTPEVAAAKVQHAAAYSAIATEHALEDVSVADPTVETAVPVAPVVYQAAAPVVQAASPVVQAPVPVVYQAAAPIVQAAAPVVHQAAAPIVQATVPVVYQAAAAPVVQAAAPVAVIAPHAADSQFHSQDDIGQYSYGYSDGNSVKQEVKTADGVVRGAYSYVDADGIVQTVNYIADALGFRVGATNLPVHIVDETAHVAAAAPVAVAAAPVAAVDYAPVMAPKIDYSYLPYATNYGYHGAAVAPQVVASPVVEAASYVAAAQESGALPVVAADLPVVAAPAADPNTQFHAQDEFGQYNYGYSNPTQTKSEIKTADGVTRGSYSYIDANGLVQTVNYISDAMGFRVAATNLPVHHVEGVEATEPVVEAKYNVLTPNVNYSYLPYAQGYAYNMPAQAA